MFFFDIDTTVVQPNSYYEYIVPVSYNKLKLTCNGKAPPKIIVNIKNRKIKYDTSKTSQQLGSFKIDTVSPYGADVNTKVSGLTSGKIGVELQASVSYQTYKNGDICMWYNEVFINLRVDSLVYIAKEHKNNRCRYNKTLKHELKHVSVDRRTAKEYAPKIRQAVKKALKNKNTIKIRSKYNIEKAKKSMISYINKSIEPLIKSMSSKRRHRQQVIDSKREYDLLSKQCGGKF